MNCRSMTLPPGEVVLIRIDGPRNRTDSGSAPPHYFAVNFVHPREFISRSIPFCQANSG